MYHDKPSHQGSGCAQSMTAPWQPRYDTSRAGHRYGHRPDSLMLWAAQILLSCLHVFPGRVHNERPENMPETWSKPTKSFVAHDATYMCSNVWPSSYVWSVSMAQRAPVLEAGATITSPAWQARMRQWFKHVCVPWFEQKPLNCWVSIDLVT